MSVTRSRRRFAVALIACAAAAGTASCSSTDSTPPASSAPAGPGKVAPGRPPGEALAQQDGGAAPGAPVQGGQPAKGGPAQPVRPIADTRSLIFTGTVKVTVTDVEAAAADAASIATAAGGFVGGDDRSGAGGTGQAQLTLRVPSAQYAATVDRVSRLGKEDYRRLFTQDVTDQVMDVNARITTGEAGVDRIRALIARAQNIGDIVALESELSTREADLESLKARQRALTDQTTLSTITAVFRAASAPAKPGSAQHTGFLAGLTAGWHGFVTAMTVVATVLGAVLPWAVVFGVPALLVVRWRRRTRRPAPTSV